MFKHTFTSKITWLDNEKILSYGYCVFLARQKFDDLASLGSVDRDIDLLTWDKQVFF